MQVEALLLRGNTDDSSKEHAMMKPISSQDNNVWLALMGTTMKDVFCRLVAVILSVAVAVAVAFAGGAADVAAAAAAAWFYICVRFIRELVELLLLLLSLSEAAETATFWS